MPYVAFKGLTRPLRCYEALSLGRPQEPYRALCGPLGCYEALSLGRLGVPPSFLLPFWPSRDGRRARVALASLRPSCFLYGLLGMGDELGSPWRPSVLSASFMAFSGWATSSGRPGVPPSFPPVPPDLNNLKALQTREPARGTFKPARGTFKPARGTLKPARGTLSLLEEPLSLLEELEAC